MYHGVSELYSIVWTKESLLFAELCSRPVKQKMSDDRFAVSECCASKIEFRARGNMLRL